MFIAPIKAQHSSGMCNEPVAHVEPVDGWTLFSSETRDGDGFWTRDYSARRGDDEVLLNVSRFLFRPSQERFAYLVRNGFPAPGGIGPWSDTELDALIRAETTLPLTSDPVSYDLPGIGRPIPCSQTAGERLRYLLAEQVPLVVVGMTITLLVLQLADAYARMTS